MRPLDEIERDANAACRCGGMFARAHNPTRGCPIHGISPGAFDPARDVPDLVAEVRRLRALLGEIRDWRYPDPVSGYPHLLNRSWRDRIDAALRDDGAVTHPMGGEDGCADDDPSSELQPEDALEAAFWTFDSRRAGRGRGGALEGSPMAERDAFKLVVRRMLGEVRRESDLARKHRDADRDEQDLELRAAQSARAALVRRCEAMVSALHAEAAHAEEAVAAATISRSERYSEADVLRRFADIMRGIAALKDVAP